MRYTTPEWLLENLENRLRMALEQRSLPPDGSSKAASDAVDGVPLAARPSSPLQPAA